MITVRAVIELEDGTIVNVDDLDTVTKEQLARVLNERAFVSIGYQLKFEEADRESLHCAI